MQYARGDFDGKLESRTFYNADDVPVRAEIDRLREQLAEDCSVQAEKVAVRPGRFGRDVEEQAEPPVSACLGQLGHRGAVGHGRLDLVDLQAEGFGHGLGPVAAAAASAACARPSPTARRSPS